MTKNTKKTPEIFTLLDNASDLDRQSIAKRIARREGRES